MSTADPRTNLRVDVTILSLVEGDITEAAVDAIVNAANESLQLGGGVAGAIRTKGGARIQEECNRLGPIQVGQAVLTSGGNLRARYVIHAVGPRMGEGNEDGKLADATRSALRLANEHQLARVAFPAISTGIFGYPKDRCAKVMLETAVAFCENEKTSLREVEFVLYGSDTFGHFQAELDRLRSEREARTL